ncbi:helix-turn-helix domain-containing protein [Nocardiopsis sediminis]|uniref:Helix-turn-helix domain-containing protein n=1 Tax=Nocardiopsis sediminis TaxID=1778267 RepID=A0ABV8FHD7_9ACTN
MNDFAESLRYQLEMASMNQGQLAKATGWSRAQISAFCTGRRSPKDKETAVRLDEALGAGGMLARRWMEDKRRAAQPEWLRRVTDLDAMAAEIRCNHPGLLPGVVQSPGYSEAIFRAGFPALSDERIASMVKERVERSGYLLRDEGPIISIAIPDLVVRTAGSAASCALPHLLEVSHRVSVQIVPDGYLMPAIGPVRVLSFHDRLPIALAEHGSGVSVIDHPSEVMRYSSALSTIANWALNPADSRSRIQEIINGAA